jgi:hypothetical protein
MGIVYPNASVARRWNGALQARLRRIPLEQFLATRSLPIVPPGIAQDSDNLVRATVYLIEAGIAEYFLGRARDLELRQQAMVGHVACLVSRGAAQVILQPEAWRTVALVSTTQLLSPWLGLNAAALASASHTRHFSNQILHGEPGADTQISHCAVAAIEHNTCEALASMAALIATRLGLESAQRGGAEEAALNTARVSPAAI